MLAINMRLEIVSRDNGAVKRTVILLVLNCLDWIKRTAIPGTNSIFYLLIHRVLLYHETGKFSYSLYFFFNKIRFQFIKGHSLLFIVKYDIIPKIEVYLWNTNYLKNLSLSKRF